MLKNVCWALFGFIFVAFGSEGGQCEVVMEDAFIRHIIPGQKVTAAYLRLRNKNIAPCRFVSAEADIAERTEFHSHIHVNGMMKMRQIEEVMIPGGEVLEFRPGGLHLMLFLRGTEASIKSSSMISLHSRECGDVSQLVPIRKNVGQN